MADMTSMNHMARPGNSSLEFPKGVLSCLLVIALIVPGLVATALPDDGVVAASEAPARAANLATHDLIRIEGNEDFTSGNGVVEGDGTETDPFVIAGWAFDMDGVVWKTAAIHIANTTSPFVVRDVHIFADDDSVHRGIYLMNTSSSAVQNCTVEGIRDGVLIQSSCDSRIASNLFVESECRISGSQNASVAENVCCDVAIRLGSSSNITVVSNEVNYTYSPVDVRGVVVDVGYSNRCHISDNVLWAVEETGARVPSITLSRSTNCTVSNNAMNEQGLRIDGYFREHFATHEVNSENTVRMLPLRFYSGSNNVLVNRVDFGQLIIVNSSNVRLHDSAFRNLPSTTGLYFNSDVEINDCTFDNAGWLSIKNTSGLRVRHNTFDNMTEVWMTSIDGMVLSDNDFTSSPHACISMGQVSNSSIRDNRFAANSTIPISIGSSTNLTITGNLLSLGGLSVHGQSSTCFDSHTIDCTNLVGGGKPILYVKNQHDVKIDMSNYSQLIMGNCSGADTSHLMTTAAYAIQLGFSHSITVRNSGFYGFHPLHLSYADNITFTENDFVNPITRMDLWMTNNVTTYHCNFYGQYNAWSVGGIEGYTPTNIRWDNGYPDGGNYYEGFVAYDNYSGPNQDQPGSDGICDKPRDLYDLGIDRYPLFRPYISGTESQQESDEETSLWLSAIAAIVILSSMISYILFVREKPRGPGGKGTESQEDL